MISADQRMWQIKVKKLFWHENVYVSNSIGWDFFSYFLGFGFLFLLSRTCNKKSLSAPYNKGLSRPCHKSQMFVETMLKMSRSRLSKTCRDNVCPRPYLSDHGWLNFPSFWTKISLNLDANDSNIAMFMTVWGELAVKNLFSLHS